MEIKRRDFLKLFGGVTGSVVLGGCNVDDVFKLPERFVKRAAEGPGIESWKNTVCTLCSGGCGVRVRLIDGVPVSVKGNPLHPVNRGGMCPLGLNALHDLYHPDRITSPLKRIGDVGNSRWEPITWDEVLSLVGSRLSELRAGGKSHEVSFLGHTERGLMREHISRFMMAYGSPNYYQFSSTQNDTVAYSLQHGDHRHPSFDFSNARLIMSFGSNFLEEGHSPVYYTKMYSLHQEHQTRYIQIEPRMSLTGANADRWIPIRPGTYGALALGLSYVIIREELYDGDFVRNNTFGFDDWVDQSGKRHVGFRNMVLGNYYPDLVSDITGISSATILELARELGNTKPSVVLGDRGPLDNTNGTFSLMAIHSLNALLGNFDKEGGIFFVDEPPFSALPKVQLDTVAQKGNQKPKIAESLENSYPLSEFSIDSFVKNALSGKPYPLSLLFMYKGNPLYQSLNRDDLSEVLKKIPFVVSFDSLFNETTDYAHVILPDCTFLEKWDEISNVPTVSFSHISIQNPVVDKLYDTRQTGDVLIDISKRIGGTVASSFPQDTYGEIIKKRIEGVYEAGTGAVVSEGVQRLWMDYLRQRGWHVGRYSSFGEFWDLLIERGGWWNPIREKTRARNLFNTPSGKFEFFSQRLKQILDKKSDSMRQEDEKVRYELLLNRLNISARGDTVFLPHHDPVQYDHDSPVHLITFRMLADSEGQGAYLPIQGEMYGYSSRVHWQSWVEIHPDTAANSSIIDGDFVWIESSVGKVKVKAKICPGIMPGVVAIPYGLGHLSNGRYAKGRGVNPNLVIRNLYDMISGRLALDGTKVRISKAI